MDVRDLYDRLERDPKDYPLFERIWQVMSFAPSARHAQDEEMVSACADAFDYLQADGKWQSVTPWGTTKLYWDGKTLRVEETAANNSDFTYEHSFTVQ